MGFKQRPVITVRTNTKPFECAAGHLTICSRDFRRGHRGGGAHARKPARWETRVMKRGAFLLAGFGLARKFRGEAEINSA